MLSEQAVKEYREYQKCLCALDKEKYPNFYRLLFGPFKKGRK